MGSQKDSMTLKNVQKMHTIIVSYWENPIQELARIQGDTFHRMSTVNESFLYVDTMRRFISTKGFV